ncbi:hypothetical protein D3C75_1304940 [compost metagenome]
MNTILFCIAAGILVVVVMSKIPGLEHFVKPIIDLLFTAIKAVCGNGAYWVVWLAKLLLASHTELLRNMVMSAEALDPSVAVRDKEA